MALHLTQRDGTVGPASRTVAIPARLAATTSEAGRVVQLPAHVRWSGPERTYDLSDPAQRRLVYEQVLSEGTVADVERFVGLEDLLALWGDLVLPAHVREAWNRWFRDHGLPAC